jgi:hypothetical protein
LAAIPTTNPPTNQPPPPSNKTNHPTKHTKRFGSITKVNLYYSYNYGCVQGVKFTYGYDARNAQRLGVEKGLTEADLELAPYEDVVKVELKEDADTK